VTGTDGQSSDENPDGGRAFEASTLVYAGNKTINIPVPGDNRKPRQETVPLSIGGWSNIEFIRSEQLFPIFVRHRIQNRRRYFRASQQLG